MTSPTYPSPLPAWPGLTHLTTATPDRGLDLDRSVGQRQATWRFDLINGVTGVLLGQLHPIIAPAVISHDTTRTTKRQLSANFGVADSAAIDPIQDRLVVSMVAGGVTWPQGRFIFTAETSYSSTGGTRVSGTLLDEMFLVDQQISVGFPSVASITAQQAVISLVTGLPLVDVVVEPSPYQLVGSWAPGATRGQILAALAVQGDYQTPWLDNEGVFRMIRTVDPVTAEPTLDFDRGNRVIRDSPAVTSDLTTAPNRFIVTSNGGGTQKTPVIGTYDVPPSAPHSIANRGFVVPQTFNMQVADDSQAAAAARQLGLSRTIVTTQSVSTVPDPRHDSYDVVRWQGLNWLETGWSMTLQDGAPMTHALRRGFA
jgi:hypothetical protein